MENITRSDFVNICLKSIEKSRDIIAIENQKSGYKKFHKEIRDKDYLSQYREKTLDVKNHEYELKHSLIGFIGLGRCAELADFLAVEIGLALKEKGTDAVIRIVDALNDHSYLRIEIELKDEKSSLWEIDAWDPRCIDISLNDKNEYKNASLLQYGTEVKEAYSFKAQDLTGEKKALPYDLIKPKEGPPSRDPTPDKEIITKHEDIFEDNTIENSRKRKILSSPNSFFEAQQSSPWQKIKMDKKLPEKKDDSPKKN